MLPLRPIIAIIALILMPTLAVVVVMREGLDPAVAWSIAAFMGIASLSLIRISVWRPLRLARFWRKFAESNHFEFFGGLNHDPIIRGLIDKRRFVAGVSSSNRSTDEGRYRTIFSAPIESGVPTGARIYARSNDLWRNEFSDQNAVPMGQLELEEMIRCEGPEPEAIRNFVMAASSGALITDFADRYPTMIVHGAINDSIPAEPGGASGIVTVSLPGACRDATVMTEVIKDISKLAAALDQRA